MMSYTDSDVVTGSIVAQGVWIHDPGSPEATVRNYPYGASLRELTLDAGGAESYYVGREYPVVDYPEYSGMALSVSVHIPHGPTYREDVAGLQALASTKRTLYYRDNRGRAFYASLSGYREQDQDWGTLASFTVTRVDFAPGGSI